MLGLIPKDNLVALMLLLVLVFLRVNQLVACCTAVAFGFSSSWLDPFTSHIGASLLDQPFVIDGIVYLYRFPILPWICLENTLVVGGIVVGLISLLPSYAICSWTFFKAMHRLESMALERVANDAIQYRKSVADQSKHRQEKPIPPLKLISDVSADDGPTKPNLNPVSRAFDGNAKFSHTKLKSETEVSQSRGTSLQPVERQIKQRTMPTIFTGEIVSNGNDTILRETVIEVVRYRRPIGLASVSAKAEPDARSNSQTQGISMPVGNVATKNLNETTNKTIAASIAAPVEQSIVYDARHMPSQAGNRDESLRYLLWHINGSRESLRKSSEKTA